MLFIFGIIGVIANWVAGKMLNRNIRFTTAFFLSGTLIIPLLLYFSDGNLFATVCTIALWGFLYSANFLNASTYMISAAPGALEFANSLATSLGNLGVTLGTTVGGWIIVSKGVEFSPWRTMRFGFLAFLMIALRQFLEKRNAIKQTTVAQYTSQ